MKMKQRLVRYLRSNYEFKHSVYFKILRGDITTQAQIDEEMLCLQMQQ